jgi:hypothetical protein
MIMIKGAARRGRGGLISANRLARRPVRALILAVGAGCTAAAIAVTVAIPAWAGGDAASAKPGWSVVQVFPDTQNTYVQQVAEAGSRAWLVGTSADSLFAADWNGARWQAMATPPDMTDPGDTFNDFAIGAASPTDLWTVVQVSTASDKTSQYSLYWNGTKWTQYTAPSLNGELAVLSPSDVWGFGEGTAYHFNGRQWHRAATPGLVNLQLTAVSARDIWAAGSTAASINSASPVWHVAHWTGKRWSTISVLPKFRIGRKRAIVTSALVTGPHNAWAVAALPVNRCGCQAPAGGLVLAHWNGRTWRAELTSTRYYPQGAPVLDGHGGLWEVALIGGTFDHMVLLHYSDGKLQRTRPAKKWLIGFAIRVPGASSVWATASTAAGDIVILRYTP